MSVVRSFHYGVLLTGALRGDITAADKKAYIAAVLCKTTSWRAVLKANFFLLGITKAPSKLSSTQYPGAKSRYDDFVAIHMKNTMSIHGTVSSLILALH